MAENSKTEWCDRTFNPWIDYTKVSEGCQHSNAEQMMDKRYGKVKWGPQGERVRTSPANWRKPLAWNKQAEKDGRRYRVFCASLADVFEIREGHSQCDELQEWREDLFDLIMETPNLDWLLLTKRPQNVMDTVRWWARMGGRVDVDRLLERVWLGTSVENQEQADKRIPELLKVPAKIHFLSMEPMLGPVNLFDVDGEIAMAMSDYTPLFPADAIDWVIVGGESGPNARPMHPDWARDIRDQCVEAGAPFFFKQWGEYAPTRPGFAGIVGKKSTSACSWGYLNPNGDFRKMSGSPGKWPLSKYDGISIVKVGKHASGRLLDGVEWNQFPQLDQNGQPMA